MPVREVQFSEAGHTEFIICIQTIDGQSSRNKRNGEMISSSMAEFSVNLVISKRFVKQQQQQWKKKEVHLLLQVRTQVLNEE